MTCVCCYDCEKHQVNEKHGYIIPCTEKYDCPKYTTYLATEKAANQAARKASTENAAMFEIAHRAFKKRNK